MSKIPSLVELPLFKPFWPNIAVVCMLGRHSICVTARENCFVA